MLSKRDLQSRQKRKGDKDMNKKNFETNSQKVVVRFKEFKLGNIEDGKIGYYI